MSIKPKLGAFDLTMIVVSMVIGVGIFRTPALVAASAHTVPLFFTAWIVGGLVSLCGALTYAEIGSRFSVAGGFYKIVSDCYHPAYALMLNWVYVLTLGAGAAGVAIIGAEYINPIIFPAAWQGGTLVKLTVIFMIVVLYVINFMGIKVGARAQNLLTIVKVIMILGLCTVVFGKPAPADPIVQGPVNTLSLFQAIGVSLIAVFYTYGGYQGTINFGGDIINPRRDTPLAILCGIAIIISLYLLINYAYVHILGIQGVAGSQLVAAEAAKAFFGSAGNIIISVSIFFSVLGFANVMLMQTPRMYYAMAEDKVLPPVFKKINSRTQVQEFALTFITAIILISVFFLGTFEKIVSYVMFIDSISLATVAASLFILRKRAKGKAPYTGFRVPLYPVVPLIFILFLLCVTFNVVYTDPVPAFIGFCFFLAGYPLYKFMRKLYPETEAVKEKSVNEEY
jgi:APA family basic amino acid/polyamine antiporter